MAQLNVYVPDDLLELIKKKAKHQGESISAFLVNLVKRQFKPDRWQKKFFSDVVGGWQGEFPDIPDSLPEEVEGL